MLRLFRKYFIGHLLLLALGAGLMWIVTSTGTFYGGLACGGGLSHISRHMACGERPVVSKRAYAELKQKLLDYINGETEKGSLVKASVYFRDLESGPTLGIGEHDQYAPASLLKLPLAVTYAKILDEVPTLQDVKLSYSKITSPIILNQTIKPIHSIVDDKLYSIDELMRYMMAYSDNKAYAVLRDYLTVISPDQDLLRQTYTDLGVIDPQASLEETLTVKTYASIFVQLYNATYLEKPEVSEKLLSLMTNSEFTGGIRAGVPSHIAIASKFGERSLEGSGLQQLHDCGIVYYPRNPYLLCVMTKGENTTKLSGVISSISKIVYEEFDSRKY